jgi:hypothetical protein
MPAVADYLNPGLPAGLARVTMRVIDATPAPLEGYWQRGQAQSSAMFAKN